MWIERIPSHGVERKCGLSGLPSGSVVKILPANEGDAEDRRVQSLGQEDPLEEEMATHSSILAGKTPWTEKSGWLQSMGSQRVAYLGLG